jgi:hypothetical protein
MPLDLGSFKLEDTPEERASRKQQAFESREKLLDQSSKTSDGLHSSIKLYQKVANQIKVSPLIQTEFLVSLDGLSDEEISSAVHMFLLQNAPERLGNVTLDDDGNMQWTPNQI